MKRGCGFRPADFAGGVVTGRFFGSLHVVAHLQTSASKVAVDRKTYLRLKAAATLIGG
ncbi:MAG: hypothetical protein ABI222_10685 [Opitutaceae bacterium]